MDPLSRVNIVVSPALAQFVPVTLPYGHKPVDTVAPVDTSSVPLIIADSESFRAGLTAKHERRIEAIAQWKQAKAARDMAENRKIAPGYLDGPNRLLVPTPGPAEAAAAEAAAAAAAAAKTDDAPVESLHDLKI